MLHLKSSGQTGLTHLAPSQPVKEAFDFLEVLDKGTMMVSPYKAADWLELQVGMFCKLVVKTKSSLNLSLLLLFVSFQTGGNFIRPGRCSKTSSVFSIFLAACGQSQEKH